MKIVLLGHEDIASLLALDQLVRLRPDHDYAVFLSGEMTPTKPASPTLAALDAADRALSERFLADGATPGLFEHASTLPRPNGPEGLAALAGEAPDLVISVRYRRILKNAAIAIPRHGVINLHSGILPDYRGVMATFWAMLAGEPEIGTTLHRIVDAGIDTGPVIAISRQAVRYSSSYLSNVISLYRAGCRNVADAVDRIASGGRLPVAEQPAGEGRYYGPPGESDAAAFVARGLSLADGTEMVTCRTIVRSW